MKIKHLFFCLVTFSRRNTLSRRGSTACLEKGYFYACQVLTFVPCIYGLRYHSWEVQQHVLISSHLNRLEQKHIHSRFWVLQKQHTSHLKCILFVISDRWSSYAWINCSKTVSNILVFFLFHRIKLITQVCLTRRMVLFF